MSNFVSFEYFIGTLVSIICIVLTLISGLVAVIWRDNSTRMTKHEEDDSKTKQVMWVHINKAEEDITEIKTSHAHYAAQMAAFQKRIDEIPNHKELCDMFKESEGRIESRIITIITAKK
jgi:primase-polymerase (primpol)-like protein